MPEVVGVGLRPAGKVDYYDPGDLPLAVGDPVVVKTIRGLELGTVVSPPAPPRPGMERPRRILRAARETDLADHFRNRLRAQEAMRVARARIREHRLPMTLLEAEYTLDGSKVVLYFFADGRVDFRRLVRDLATSLQGRIELHQVGARDRAGLAGGLGPCGRECCCSSWLREFTPVSIKMARDQGLSLNPSRISGSCGRLMCCLRYEYSTYLNLRRALPRVGDELKLPEGKVRVLEVNVARYLLKVEHPEKGVFEVPAGRARLPGESEVCRSCGTVKTCAPGAARRRRPRSRRRRRPGS